MVGLTYKLKICQLVKRDKIETLFAIIIGIVFGIVCGLIPSFHPNTILPIIQNAFKGNQNLGIFICALIPAQLIGSIIPSQTIKSANINSSSLAFIEDKSNENVQIAIYSALIAFLISAVFFWASFDLFSSIYLAIKDYIKYIVLGVSLITIFRNKPIFLSALVFLCSGFFAKATFDIDFNDPFLVIFGGLFGISGLIFLNEKEEDKKKEKITNEIQNTINPERFGRLVIYCTFGVFLGFISNLFPAIGSPALFALIFIPIVKYNKEAFIATTISISFSQLMFSLSSALSIGKIRVGSIQILAQNIDIGKNTPELIAVFLLSGAISAFIVSKIDLKKVIGKIDANKRVVSLVVLLLIAGLNLFVNGI